MKNIIQKINPLPVNAGQGKINKKPNQPGKWVYKPTRSTVLVCSCGNKYIATRENQIVCVSCIKILAQNNSK
ncbi:MAG: hypothetical protein AAB818_00955 [Patescibacteria group bacterium]